MESMECQKDYINIQLHMQLEED